MTISTTNRRDDYIGTGGLATYAYTFKVFDGGDLLLFKTMNGVESTLILNVNYTVTGVGVDAGGTIILSSNLENGALLAIRSLMDLVQETDIRNQKAYFPEVLEDTIDRLVMYDQQQQDQIDRSLKFSESEDPAVFNGILPSKADRATRLLAFDSNGNPIATSVGLGIAAVSAFIQTLLDDTDAPSAKQTLNVIDSLNFTQNGDFEQWDAGVTTVPTLWTIQGAGATIAKNTTVGQFKYGASSAALTRVGNDCDLVQNIVNIPGFGPAAPWRGKTITVGCWVRATVADRARIAINDGIGQTNSSFHSGGGAFEFLTVTRILDAATSAVNIFLSIASGNTTAQFDGVVLVGGKYVNDFIPSFTPYGLGSGIFVAKGDLIVGGAAQQPLIKTVGANGTIPMARSADAKGLAYVAALTKTIHGLVPSYGGGDQLTLSAGGAMDATGAYFMTLASSFGKFITSAWAVGDGNGGRDTGADSNNEWYVWLIARSDTDVVDVLLSLSATAPTMPPNYDFKRLVGYFRRLAGTNTVWTAYETEGGGIEISWDIPTLDINLANTLTTARRTDAVKVPTAFSTIAHLNVQLTDASAQATNWIYCPDQTDAAPSQTAAPLNNAITYSTTGVWGGQMKVRTSAAGLIAARSTLATVDLYAVATMGFTWARRA